MKKKFDLGFKFEKKKILRYVFRMFMWHKEFHQKDVKNSGWKAVAEELRFEDGKNYNQYSIPKQVFL